jgi:hypothetical protein
VQRAVLSGVLFLLAGACADPVTTPPAADPSDTFSVRCDGMTTEILTPTVQARADGVHLVLENTSDHELLMQTEAQGEGVQPGETAMRLLIPPGSSRFRCLEMSDDLDPGIEGGWAAFRVLPPDGWVSPTLDCPIQYSGTVDYIRDAHGVADPLADAPRHFREEGDRVVQAGYATPDERTCVLLRDEEPIAGLVYISDGYGGWLQSESFGCSD